MRRVRDHSMNQPHTDYLRMFDSVLHGFRITLLRVAPPWPGASCPGGFHPDLLRGCEQLPPNALESLTEGVATGSVQLREGCPCCPCQVHPGEWVSAGVLHCVAPSA